MARLRSVTIEAVAPSPDRFPRLPVWLAAWLAGQLGWEAVRRGSPGPGRIEAAFRSGENEVAVSIRAEADPSARSVSLRSAALGLADGAGPSSIRLARPPGCPDDVRIESCSDRACALPRVVHLPELDTPRRISAAMESSRHDPPFRRALPHALWLLS